ncbi:MAG: CHAT domain-containing protein [Planctomycetota bacterium]|jgi:CHAT domain-containing protein
MTGKARVLLATVVLATGVVGQAAPDEELVEIVARITSVHPGAKGGPFVHINRGALDGIDVGREGEVQSLFVSGKRDSARLGGGRVVDVAKGQARVKFAGKDVRAGDVVLIKARVPRKQRSVLWDIALRHIELTDVGRKTVWSDFRALRAGEDAELLDRAVAAALADVRKVLETERALEKFVDGAREGDRLTGEGRWKAGRYAGRTPVETLQALGAADVRAYLDYVASFPAKYQGHRYRMVESLAAWIMSFAPPSTAELLGALETASDEEAARLLKRFEGGIIEERIVTRWRLKADELARDAGDGRAALRRVDAAARAARLLRASRTVDDRWKAWFGKELRRQRVSRGRALRVAGRAEEARPILRAALEDLRRKPPLRDAEADALAELGEVELARRQYLAARRWFTQAAALNKDLERQPRIQIGIGEAELALGRKEAASTAFERARDLARARGDGKVAAEARLARARVLIQLQKQDQAHEIFTDVFAERRQAGDLVRAARAAEEQARVYVLYGKVKEANEALTRALYSFPRLVDKARILRDAASMYGELGHRKLHDDALGAAIKLLQDESDRVALADALRQRADFHYEKNEYEQAGTDFRAAGKLYEKAGALASQGETEFGLGKIAYYSGSYAVAAAPLESAAKLLAARPRRSAQALLLLGSAHVMAGALDAAVEVHTRALGAARAAGAGDLEVDILLDRANARLGRRESGPAERDIGAAYAAASRENDRTRMAQCHRRLGLLARTRFNWETCERELLRAFALFKEADETQKQIEVLNDLADLKIDRGEFARAEEWYGIARKAAHERKLAAHEGTALRGLSIARRHLGRLAEALKAVDAASALGATDKVTQARNLHERGLVLSAAGRILEADKVGRQALALYVELKDRWSEVAMLNNLALNDLRLGRYEKARLGFLRARERAQGLEDGRIDGVLALNMGKAHLGLSRKRETHKQRVAELETALAEADAGVRHLEKVRMPAKLAEVWMVRAQVLSAWARALREEAAGSDRERVGALRREASRLASTALSSFGASADFFRAEKMRVRLANTLMRQARELVRLKRPAEALQAADDALAAVKDTGAREVEWETRFARSQALEGLAGKLGEAREERARAIALVEKLVSAAGNPGDRRAVLESKVELYDAMADLLLRLSREAGQDKDKARKLEAEARRMMQRVSDEYRSASRRKTMRGESEDIRKAEARLAAAERGLERATDDASRKVVAVEYEKAAAELLQAYENDAGLRQRSAVDVRDLDRFLPKGTLLLHYFPGEDVLTIWLARRKRDEKDERNTLLFSVPVGKDRINALVRACRDRMLDFGYALQDNLEPDPAAGARLDADLARLYDLLVPAEPKAIREEFEAAKRVVVIPHGDLYVLPFEALRGPNGYLGKDKAFVYFIDQSHVSTRLPQTRGRLRGGDRWAAFANPRGDLVEAKREVDAITAWWKQDPKVYAGPQATKDAVLNAIKKDFTILHFATHGRLKSDVSETSIELHDVQLTRKDVEQLMRTEEYMDGFADVRLVVISACNSAVGQRAPVEHVFGFPDSLQRAGVAGIVGSLWPVESGSASLFMQSFYKHLLSEKSGGVAESLRAARAELMNYEGGKYVHPYYWAPFLLYGDWR